MNSSPQHMHPFEERSRFPDEVTVSRISTKTVEITSEMSISMGEEVPVRHRVRRGSLAWKVAVPWEYAENP